MTEPSPSLAPTMQAPPLGSSGTTPTSSSTGSFLQPSPPTAPPAAVCADAVRAFASLQDAVLRGSQSAERAVDAWTAYVRAVGTVPAHARDDNVTAVLQTLFTSLESLSAALHQGGGGLAGQVSPASGGSFQVDDHGGGGSDTHSPPARGRLRARVNASPLGPASIPTSAPPPYANINATGLPIPHTPGTAGPDDGPAAVRGGSFRQNKSSSPRGMGGSTSNIDDAAGLAPPLSALEGGLSADECEGFRLE